MSQSLLKEELQELKDLQDKVNLLSLSVGQLEIQKWSFYEDFKNLQKEQDNLGKKLQDKYGDGNINLEEGTFTKAK